MSPAGALSTSRHAVAGPVAQLGFDGSRRLEGVHLTCLQSKQHNNILRSYYESSESLSDEP